MSKYVLVSQGIKLFETESFEGAFKFYTSSNKEYYKYRQECADNYEPCADNEVFMYEETDDGEFHKFSFEEIIGKYNIFIMTKQNNKPIKIHYENCNPCPYRNEYICEHSKISYDGTVFEGIIINFECELKGQCDQEIMKKEFISNEA